MHALVDDLQAMTVVSARARRRVNSLVDACLPLATDLRQSDADQKDHVEQLVAR